MRAGIVIGVVAVSCAFACRRDDADDWAKARFGAKEAALITSSELLGRDVYDVPPYLPRPFVVMYSDETMRPLGFHVLNKTMTGVAQSRAEIRAYVTVSMQVSGKTFAHTKQGAAVTSDSKVQAIRISDQQRNLSMHAWVEGHSTSALESFLSSLPSEPPR
jgi:hypothetical protein